MTSRNLQWLKEIGADIFYEKNAQNRYIKKNISYMIQDIHIKTQHKQNINNPAKVIEHNIIKNDIAKGCSTKSKNHTIELINNMQESIINNVIHDEKMSVNRMTSSSRAIADNAKSIDELYNAIRKFEGCDLKKAAKSTVIGDGTISDILLIGEAPGAQEDTFGVPFCGQSGKLLNNILQSINLTRKRNCYITNTVFWRPPGNRRPTSEEISICRPFVEKHIALINPKVIILVGSTAVESLLNIKQPIKMIKNQYFDYTNCYMQHTIKTAIILHPSYLLRQPTEKKQMWFDILKIKNELISKI